MSTSAAQVARQSAEEGVISCSLEEMAWMMSMLVASVTFHAQVIIIAILASDEFLFRKNWKCLVHDQYQKPSYSPLTQQLQVRVGSAGSSGSFGSGTTSNSTDLRSSV
jgi:hypothetical protein